MEELYDSNVSEAELKRRQIWERLSNIGIVIGEIKEEAKKDDALDEKVNSWKNLWFEVENHAISLTHRKEGARDDIQYWIDTLELFNSTIVRDFPEIGSQVIALVNSLIETFKEAKATDSI